MPHRNGEHINIAMTITISILNRIGFNERKNTKVIKNLLADFDSIKEALGEERYQRH